MKRIVIIVLASLGACGVVGVYVWIATAVDGNIDRAQQKYGGSAEDALIAYLLDSENSARDRTHIAVWTLGKIQSEKAVPILEQLYENDPDGETCYGNHDSAICQYELFKAIDLIRSGWSPFAQCGK